MSDSYIFPFYENEKKLANEAFLRQPFNDTWETYTWQEAGLMARKLASGLRSLNLAPGSHIGLISKNCREWIIADLAIIMGGYVSVPLYPNLTGDQVKEVLTMGDVEAVFVGKVDDWEDMKTGIDKDIPVIGFPSYSGFQEITGDYSWHAFIDAHEPIEEIVSPKLSETWTIVFTSGTTGSPKGVVLTYGVLDSTKCLIENNILNISQEGDNRYFSFLPLNHIAERVIVQMGCISYGGSISFAESLVTFADNLRNTRPTVFFAVPRIWTKFQLGILSKIPQEKLDVLLADPTTSDQLAKNLRQSLGLDESRGNLTGAAPIPQTVKDWYKKIGVRIHEGYGMTENCAITTLLSADDTKRGSVGRPQPRAELKIDPNTNEILMRAPYMMSGYYKDPKRTAETIRDGWLHTGDEGRIDEDGYLYITGRVKDTFKTAKGKFIVPAPLEWEFSQNSNIEQICVMGLGCPQPLALVCLSEIGQHKSNDDVIESISNTLQKVNSTKPNYQKVSTIVISREPWSVESGILTPTLKVRRNMLHNRYKDQLQKWHEDKDKVLWV